MVGVVDLHQGGLIQVVSVDDATVVFVMLTPQQDVELADEGGDVLGLGRSFRAGFAQGVQIPAGGWVELLPEDAELLPGEQAEQRAVEQKIEFRIPDGVHVPGLGQG